MALRAPSLSTSKVMPRDVIEDDLPVFFEHQRDPDATQMAAFPARERQPFDAHWARILANPVITKKTIVVDGQVAGNLVSFEQDGKVLVGYRLGKRYWRQGIAIPALAQFLDHVTAHPLYAHVAKHNKGSIGVLEKCGFTIQGEDKGLADPSGAEVGESFYGLEAGARFSGPDSPYAVQTARQ